MILTGPEILLQVESGDIEIDPFDPKLINPASIDLRLGARVAIYESWVTCTPKATNSIGIEDGSLFIPRDVPLDVKSHPHTRDFTIHEKVGWVLRPGIGYLMHTLERICTRDFVPVLDGKSSIGRLFTTIHVTAGYGDPNFSGQYTLEVIVQHPLRVYPGMRFAQMRFHRMTGEYLPYDGNYQGKDSIGPVASKAYRQFQSS